MVASLELCGMTAMFLSLLHVSVTNRAEDDIVGWMRGPWPTTRVSEVGRKIRRSMLHRTSSNARLCSTQARSCTASFDSHVRVHGFMIRDAEVDELEW
jgi:hypothetical protein